MPSKRRHDPERRERIIEAALDVIAEHGIAGTTHRRIAERADVPLGSMTYHFTGLDELILAAFSRLYTEAAARYEALLSQAQDAVQVQEAVVELICGQWWSERNKVLESEFYAYASRMPALKSLLSEWVSVFDQLFKRYFSDAKARALLAFIEGVCVYNRTYDKPMTRTEVAESVRRLSADLG